jgi:outer membrane protein OmpA-like peptidoglycan-associated protein
MEDYKSFGKLFGEILDQVIEQMINSIKIKFKEEFETKIFELREYSKDSIHIKYNDVEIDVYFYYARNQNIEKVLSLTQLSVDDCTFISSTNQCFSEDSTNKYPSICDKIEKLKNRMDSFNIKAKRIIIEGHHLIVFI